MTSDLEIIGKNLEEIRTRAAQAAKRAGRDPSGIRLVAVTKTIDIPRIQRVIEEGILDLGENRVQELLEKADNIQRECFWHLIGHLQTNKVKYIIDKVAMIHSVDRLELAEELQARAQKSGRTVDLLVQVNVSGETSKFGIPPGEVKDFVRKLGAFENLRTRGLMTIAPYTEDPESVRPVFRELREIFIDTSRENIDNMNMEFLSMGMSNDFEVAIEEGANMVRIGTAIFGNRQYK